MADPNQTPERGDWVCPCTGCQKARKKAFAEVLDLLNATGDIMYNVHMVRELVTPKPRIPKTP